MLWCYDALNKLCSCLMLLHDTLPSSYSSFRLDFALCSKELQLEMNVIWSAAVATMMLCQWFCILKIETHFAYVSEHNKILTLWDHNLIFKRIHITSQYYIAIAVFECLWVAEDSMHSKRSEVSKIKFNVLYADVHDSHFRIFLVIQC